ncbi:polysaccharide deacetylase family protein [Moheibacter sediminis]|uniref:Peptidoglycan/xylan/chitin deacetylase, PgdA/CDA1 family n=1 Tax=Moheibacter sediminis TaxID=1434700 RepID=A0A1W2AUV1_9FLAO|nr:polysaccharide deacetylase family protein [Moheibacter sediminis]SMC64475.1 Peptidoglycan/xylan/chitin deacetylase, PgdA/CDA1 family [Moheibacter sediminis]
MSKKLFVYAFILSIFISLTHCQSASDQEPKTALSSAKIPEREIPEEIEKPTPTPKKYLYITFDDGPNKGTQNVIKTLKKEQVSVTMFLVGEHIFGSKDQWFDFNEIINDTIFEIANHSYSHANNQFMKYYKDSVLVLNDFNRMNDSLKRKLLIGRTPGRNIWRTPTLNITDIKSSKESADYLSKNQYKLIGWDWEWKSDEKSGLKQTGDKLFNEIDSLFFNNKTRTQDHLVLLTHDQYFKDSISTQELEKFLKRIKTREDIVVRKIRDYPDVRTAVN